MSTKPQIELFLENESGTQQVAYPFVESDHVSLSNGMDIDTMIRQDVSMPTVAHEDLSFKVGVGDQDVSSAIVDSSVAEMTIKGKTYQNILPEPSTHVLTNNKEMFKVNEGLDPNAEIVDGVSKSAILSGNTLVNLIKNGYIPTSSTNKEYATASIVPLDGSKEYTLMLNKNLVQINVRFWYTDGSWGDDYEFSSRVTSGYIKNKIQIDRANATGKTLENIQIYSVDANEEITNIMLLEGDYTNVDVPYFEGMQSVKMPVLTTVGKNLLNPSWKKEYGKFYPFKLKKGTTLTLSTKDSVPSLGGNLLFTTVSGGEKWFSIDEGATKNTTTLYEDVYQVNNILIGDIEYQLEIGSTATPFEPYKSNILSTPSDLELRGIGDVKDTLDLTTGEVTKRIEEIVLDGGDDEEWITTTGGSVTHQRFVLKRGNRIKPISNVNENLFLCDKFNTVNSIKGENSKEMCLMEEFDEWYLSIVIDNTKLNSLTVNGFKSWLQSNNVKMQYVVESESIKTVDLSSSGNWEKVVLDGSEDERWLLNTSSNGTGKFFVLDSTCTPNLPHTTNTNAFCDRYPYVPHITIDNGGFGFNSSYGLRFHIEEINIYKGATVEDFRQYLQQNPITVWYQTQTHQDSTQVKQPIFFKDGHIQLSSGADNSLIPTLDYQAKTSNSYVMDLMKTNTRYTMKAKTASGTFTIDGTSYGAGTNGTFTTPSSMTNKFLVMSNKTNEEIVILEGDVTDKVIPYFKGIKSAFEDEDKIEVLSTSQNILDTSKIVQGDLLGGGIIGATGGSADNWCYTIDYIPCPSIKQKLYAYRTVDGQYSSDMTFIYFFNDSKELLGSRVQDTVFKIPVGAKYMRIMVYKGDIDISRVGIMVTNSGTDRFDQSVGGLQNNTKIPLLSSLRSLPNGVKDEVIVNRENHKAEIIQRVGKVDFSISKLPTRIVEQTNGVIAQYNFINKSSNTGNDTIVTDRFYFGGWSNENPPYTLYVGLNKDTYFVLPKYLGLTTVEKVHQWFIDNNVSFYYELETPVITEVDLEGFLYIYKDGHIFLNGEIAPVTEIKYSINQQHQIEANNQDIMRHQKEIDYLYKLIGEYVRVDYKNTLLSLNLELK